ncbi:hypothetical protein [Olivibacter jilunii]|uniref:hypothetical protein n=1 Tax=Olivibacter jilunii TaxID=985016 RepID=UPI001030DB73|nr:hypothetical protein [Olivibacter jilunii]
MLCKLATIFILSPFIAASQKLDSLWIIKGSKISEIIAFEKKIDPTSIMYFNKTNIKVDSPFRLIANKHKYDLGSSSPLIVERKQHGTLPLTIEYYYTPDSIVRGAIYYWEMRYYSEKEKLGMCAREHLLPTKYKKIFLELLYKLCGYEVAESEIVSLKSKPINKWWFGHITKNNCAIYLKTKFISSDHEVTAWIYWL